ncbi:NBAS subunit of NRZ tethering complex-like [Mya arenaria]|uniref:NBAS subunit of NRZ tethering complex-like n=1 Tax=Mya arenaria TaxID=6604 RepID=UPI0022E6085B|nr:NBAS subunit of NRZ tethering complex-like [Mya arenaria]
MATSDVENNDSPNILYDLTVHAEWKHEHETFRAAINKGNFSTIEKITSTTQRKGWTVLRSIGLPFQAGSSCSLPASLVKLMNCTINWHIAVTRDGSMVAVMQDQYIEIRSQHDDYGSVTGRVSIQRDSHPQWRNLSWSTDGTMLACAYSSGTIHVFDIVGTLLFTIAENKEPTQSFVPTVELSQAVAALIFTENTKDIEWVSELRVVRYSGRLSCYKAHRDKGCRLVHEFSFSKQYPLGISCVSYDEKASLLYVGGGGDGEEGVTTATREGLTAWRILSDSPHYKLITDYADDLNKAQGKKRFKMPLLRRLRGVTQDGVLKASISPMGDHLCTLHFSGKLGVWALPGLHLIKAWAPQEQPYWDELSPELTDNPQVRKQIKDLVNTKNLLDLSWWSNEALILARGTGAVTVSSVKTLANLLGKQPEWFEPAPRLTEVHNGGFLGLEVECRFPRKRLLSVTDDEDEDSEEEDAGLVSRSWGLAKNALHYLTDMDTFKPPKKKPKLVNRTYRLVCLKSTTPEELFARKLENEEYGEAKQLAQAYGLDVDLVYQRQWKKSAVERAAIQDYLSKISKRSWVLHECMERMSDRIDAMKELLEFGLRGTDLPALIMIGKGEDQGRFILCDEEDDMYEDLEPDQFDPEYEAKREQLRQNRISMLLEQVEFDNLNLEQRELCRARKKLLQYLYRLKTYEYILGGVNAAERYDAKFFEKFRSQNMVQTAITYAQNSDWKALEILLTYHGEELLPHRLSILNNFPETTNPEEFKILLPEIRDGSVVEWGTERWEVLDWVEREPCHTALALPTPDPGHFLYEEQPQWNKYRGDVSAPKIKDWYETRAIEIERLCRQADCSLKLIQLAMERGVQGLECVHSDLVTMEMLVYCCHIEETFTFQQLRDMDHYHKLELIMSKSSDEMYSKNLRKWLVPFLRQTEKQKSGSYISLLRQYITNMAKHDLVKPLQIFESSKTHLPSPVIPKQSDLMSIAIEAIYCCERADQLKQAEDILMCLPKPGYGADTKDIQKLHTEVDKVENHLFAAKILAKYGVKKPVHYMRDSESNGDEGEQLMIKLTRLVGRREGEVTFNQWAQLHADMMELQDKVYRCVSQALGHEVFVESLLCSSRASYIKLADTLVERSQGDSNHPTPLLYTMHTRVPYQRAVHLVLQAAEEYFNSSANLSDMCINLARSCLSLIQDRPAGVQEELDLISSLSILDDFGVSILPLQVRLCKERLELVKRALDASPTNYKHKQKVLRLGHLLRVGGEEQDERDGQVLHLLAMHALKNDDVACAYELCKELISLCHGPAWDVCVDLAEHAAFTNVHARLDLLSFAVTYCSPDMIEPVLQARAVIETQVLCEGISSRVEETSEDSGARVSPFSARAALQHTHKILTSTGETTRAVLSTVTDARWWQGTVNKLTRQVNRQASNDLTNRNVGLHKQACHPFYEGLIEHCFENEEESDFRHIGESSDGMAPQVAEKLLHAALLEEMLTEGEKSHSTTAVLLQLATESFSIDSTLSLAYLLAMRPPMEAEPCFSAHPVTDISLQLALYYYCLQLYTALRPSDLPHLSPLYVNDPVKVMRHVTSVVCGQRDVSWPESVVALVTKVRQYRERLEDYRQAQILSRLSRGIDTGRFASDPEYKEETILGLAMSQEENIYEIAVSLAEKNNIPVWQVYAAQIEALFSEPGLDIEELQTRVTKLGLVEALSGRPADFCNHMTTRVYPDLEGTDHALLTYYYTTMQKCDSPLQGGLTADGHVKLLKKLKSVAAGLDYKRLLESGGSVMEVLSPCLTNTNITTFAKLAKHIPDGKGGTLDASVVYCAWAVKYFWEGDGKKQPENSAGWVHRYEACGEFLQKLQPEQLPHFLQAVLYTTRATTSLDAECRHEICKRSLKIARQQMSKKKLAEDMKSSWESTCTVVNGYLQHLSTLSDMVVMTMASSEVTRVQEYFQIYNLSKGDRQVVYELLISIVLEGLLPLETVSELLGVMGPLMNDTDSHRDVCSLQSLVHDSTKHILLTLSGKPSTFTPLVKTEPLSCLESLRNVVQNIQEHIEDGGSLLTSERLLSQLRPFCSDSSVEVQPRLDVLHILEKSFKLSDEDMVLLHLYRTQAVITDTWHDCKISHDEIATAKSRCKLFFTLLEKTIQAKGENQGKLEFFALVKLLKLWPAFPANICDPEKPWFALLKEMVKSGCRENTSLVLETLKSECTTLSRQEAESLFEELEAQGHCAEAVKLALMSGYSALHSPALLTLANMPQISEDTELITLILRHRLVPQLVSSAHYPIIVQYLLANQEPEPGSHEYLSVQGLAVQLKEDGYEAEAGSLMYQVKTTPPVLQTFGGALGAMSKWFK